MHSPKITIIIPTRERGDVLQKSLKTAITQDYGELHIIVSDNFSQDSTEEVVRSVADPRVKYLNTGQRLSMSHNWEFALSQVEDGWVTIIGDDDGILPDSVSKVADLIRTSDVRAIRSSVCSYSWPSLIQKSYGRLAVPLLSGHEVRSSQEWLSRVLDGLAAYPELPMLYNGGYVDMSVLWAIKNKTGAFYKSCNPDVYSAISISAATNRYMYLHEPLAINGASRHSTGTSHFSEKETSKSSPSAKFREEANIPLHADFPVSGVNAFPRSLQAMVYESYLQSEGLHFGNGAVSQSDQLATILATSGSNGDTVRTWAEEFATRHGLDFPAIQTAAARHRPAARMRALANRVSGAITTYSVGSPKLPIPDVYAASVAAKAIRDSNPSIVHNTFRLIGRVLAKSLAA